MVHLLSDLQFFSLRIRLLNAWRSSCVVIGARWSNRMKLSVIGLDYDGTITRDDRPNPSMIDAIADARRRGIAVMLVTGRGGRAPRTASVNSCSRRPTPCCRRPRSRNAARAAHTDGNRRGTNRTRCSTTSRQGSVRISFLDPVAPVGGRISNPIRGMPWANCDVSEGVSRCYSEKYVGPSVTMKPRSRVHA